METNIKESFVKVAMVITFSKAMAFYLITLAFIMDFLNDRGGTVFMFVVPFVVFLITGKQIVDYKADKKVTDSKTSTNT